MATSCDRKGTGPKPASDAGKLLRKPKTPKDVKDVAASDLAQHQHRRTLVTVGQTRLGRLHRPAHNGW